MCQVVVEVIITVINERGRIGILCLNQTSVMIDRGTFKLNNCNQVTFS